MAIQISAIDPPLLAPRPAPQSAPVALRVVADLLKGLNREQRSAVKHGDGPLMVVAGPGTGKTEVLTRRVAWLIATKRARPHEILALTFTDNAAEEMRARVDTLVPYGQADAAVHTFHAFGDRLVREHAFELGLSGDLRLITRSEAIIVLREHLFELGLQRYRPLGDPTRFLGALVDLFQRAKEENVSPERLAAFVNGDSSVAQDIGASRAELSLAYARYQSLLSQRGLIDHGDQIWLALKLLHEQPGVRAQVAGRYRYVLVDEFQDVNRAQIELVLALCGAHRNVTIVGDPNQSIYTFRGAATRSTAAFQAGLPDLRRVVLRRNYRSTQPIVDAAQLLAAHLPEPERFSRQVASRRSLGTAPVRSISYAHAAEEADGVADAIESACGAGARPRDFAVLARSNAEIEPLASALRVRGLPVRTLLPTDFYAQPAVRPLLAFLRVIADPDQTIELYALATSQPYQLGGPELTELLTRSRRRHQSLWQTLAESPTQKETRRSDFSSGVGKLVDHVRAGIEMSHERTSTEVLYDFLRRSGVLGVLAASEDPAPARAVARFFEIVRDRGRLLDHDRVPVLVPHLDASIESGDTHADTGPLDLDAVSVLTVHRAKGLEFKVVYLTGLTDGRFPARGRPPVLDLPWAEIHGESASQADPLDEERRLFFVAMTRARDELWLTTHVGSRDGRGRRRPSPFIAEALDTAPATALAPVDALAQIHSMGQPVAVESITPVAEPPSSLSFSELEEYLDCPQRYRLRHVVGLPSAPHHALAYGSALHQAVAAFHVSCGNGEPLSEEQLLQVFARAWSPEGFLSREHEDARFAAGQEALRLFHRQQVANPSPVVAVELPFIFKLDSLAIRGRMDRVDRTAEGDVIVDYKSSDVRDQAKADTRAKDSLQLQVYALAHEAACGRLPREVQLHFLDSGVVGHAVPDTARLEKARTKIRQASAGIRDGNFEARPNPISCGYCPYRQLCPSSAA